jgi:hypothetical protein
MLPVYERIMELYGPYVLIRCARYTNRRRQAEQIGVFTLITTCLLASKLPWVGQISRLIDMMVEVVEPDVVSRGKGALWWGESEELLLVDEQARRMARALNRLSGPLRAVLVLHHLAGVEPEEVARLLGEPAAQVAARIGRGERALARRLGVVDARSLLARFAAGLDTGWMQEVAACAMDYLTRQARRSRSRPACRDWN